MAAGADELGYYARCVPMLHQAGVKWLRLFPEWQDIQPRHGQWNWEASDKLVANARANNLRMLGIWCYFAPGPGRRRHAQRADQGHAVWRDYVSVTVSRY